LASADGKSDAFGDPLEGLGYVNIYNVAGEAFVYFIMPWHGLFFTHFGI
jgi:hypothetical protein